MNLYNTSKTKITQLLSFKLGCTCGLAADIIEANAQLLAEALAIGMTEEETAIKIANDRVWGRIVKTAKY